VSSQRREAAAVHAYFVLLAVFAFPHIFVHRIGCVFDRDALRPVRFADERLRSAVNERATLVHSRQEHHGIFQALCLVHSQDAHGPRNREGSCQRQLRCSVLRMFIPIQRSPGELCRGDRTHGGIVICRD
jgi:hypothetical protein